MLYTFEGVLTLPEALTDSCDYHVFDNRTMHTALHNICDVFRIIYFESPQSRMEIEIYSKPNKKSKHEEIEYINHSGVLYLDQLVGDIYDWVLENERNGNVFKLGNYLFENVGKYVYIKIFDVDYMKYKKRFEGKE